MSRSKTWCWTHMEDPCIVCERDQLQQIIKDAINECNNIISSPKYGDSFDQAIGKEQAAEAILDILERPIKPTMYEFETTQE